MREASIFGLAGLASILFVSLAPAQEARRIGQVESLRNEAQRSGKRIALGDAVFQNEVVSTGADSSVRLTFVDRTNLAIGPSSRVTLDRFVYNPSTQEMAVSLVRGAFRFVSGNLDKRAYRIDTPTATMGIRGTIININIAADGASSFTSFEGSATICSKITRECLEIGPGQSVQVSRSGQITRISTQFTFEDYCARNQTLCQSLSQRAALPGPSNPGVLLLGAVGVVGGIAGIVGISNGDSNRPISP